MQKHDRQCGLCRIELDNVAVRRGKNVLLGNVDLHIHCGELTALVGPNGAGKTTLLKAIMGIIPHDGTIRHLDAASKPLKSVKVGYVPQHLNMDEDTPLSVLDLVTAGATHFPAWLGSTRSTRAKARKLLSITRSEQLLERRLGALSGGELQRVLLAMALTPIPDLLILDEPISGMDQNGVDLFYNMVEELLKTHHMAILLVSHDFEMVRRHADRAILLRGGVLCEGKPDAVFASDEFAQVFGRMGGGAI